MRAWIAMLFLAAACAANKEDVGYRDPPPDGTMVTCPVSRDRCEKTPLTQAAVYESKTYYFCCADCPQKFRAGPERWVAPARK